ncbi:hypothetical protein EST38_g3246 [Candolleomyces aberdarensis]|uniref:Uncharacterized protein n=1 Tax=Candolleomyces aberdarensis TaxID=2316362 RepID=A0A4Q2DRH6_9AGAR|nr:hypothetical protein EST38_g3246 [Candolleomyces aberdarensis]
MLSPSVERVEFGNLFLSTPAFHTYALSLVRDGLPSLTELVLCDAGSSSQINHVWATLAGMSTRLQSLTLRFPNAFVLETTTLRKLAQQLQNLTSLTLDVHTESHRQSKDTQDQVLPSLHTLHLVNRSETKLCDCYPSFLLEKATSVTFSLTGSVANNDAFSESLDTLSTLELLKKVEIEGYPNQYVTVSSVVPFLQRLQLEELHLQKMWGFRQEQGEQSAYHIVQGLVDEISSNSRLRCLSLPIWRSRSSGYDAIKYHPVSCLLYAAQHAKGLQRMSLSIDSAAQGPNGETVTSMVQNWTNPGGSSELRYLEIAEMRDSNFTPNDYRNIARLLDLIFPNLISVTMIKNPQLSPQWEEHWQLIEEYRQMQKSLRLYQGSRKLFTTTV